MSEKPERYIRYDQTIVFQRTTHSLAGEILREYESTLPFPGDGFMGSLAREGDFYLAGSPGVKEPMALFSVKDKVTLGLAFIRPEALKLDRQIMEQFLTEFNIHYGYAASWDYHMMKLYTEFVLRSDLQAYQFQLLDPKDLGQPLQEIRINLASPEDVPFMDAQDFLTNSHSYVRRQEAWIARREDGRPVGIGVLQSHKCSPDHVDIGMYTVPSFREKGIGRTILIRLMAVALAAGRTPAAGCYWKNFLSRRTLESAGMTCIGTIFRFSFNKDRFT